MSKKREIQVGRSKEAPLAIAGSTELQSLLQANRDLAVRRDRLGEVTILQALRNGDLRRVEVLVAEGEEGNPTVIINGQQFPASYRAEVRTARAKMMQKDHTSEDVSRYYELDERRYDALRTQLRVRIGEDEHVHAKIVYGHREISEGLTMEVDPHELVTTAKRGLELLQAYLNDPSPKTYQMRNQIEDEYRPDLERRVAEASPLVDAFIRREGGYDIYGTQAIYALNALNKVTDAMLPSEMPPASQNRREPRRTLGR